MRESDELSDSRVKNPERVRKIDALIDPDALSASEADGGAGEIPETIDRNAGRLVKPRKMKGRGAMSEVVLDLVQLAA
jgi:hypothetical protein